MKKTLFFSMVLSVCLNTASASPLSSLSFANIEEEKPISLAKMLVEQSRAQNKASDIIAYGKSLIGTPYIYGGTTPKGFDCSGLVQYVYKRVGIVLPRTSRAQYQALTEVTKPDVGDLVFFRHGKRISHVGIYIGDNKMLHASSSGKHVEITSLSTPYWKKRYVGARRISDNLFSKNSVQIIAQNNEANSKASKQIQAITFK